MTKASDVAFRVFLETLTEPPGGVLQGFAWPFEATLVAFLVLEAQAQNCSCALGSFKNGMRLCPFCMDLNMARTTGESNTRTYTAHRQLATQRKHPKNPHGRRPLPGLTAGLPLLAQALWVDQACRAPVASGNRWRGRRRNGSGMRRWAAAAPGARPAGTGLRPRAPPALPAARAVPRAPTRTDRPARRCPQTPSPARPGATVRPRPSH